MKLVKEHINEKFTEESDPIHDMGIGFKDQFDFAEERRKYSDECHSNLIKTSEKNKVQLRKKLKEKLLGKKISGVFYKTLTYKYVSKTFRVSKIKISYGSTYNIYIREIFLYDSSGNSYTLIYNEKYKITM